MFILAHCSEGTVHHGGKAWQQECGVVGHILSPASVMLISVVYFAGFGSLGKGLSRLIWSMSMSEVFFFFKIFVYLISVCTGAHMCVYLS